MALTYFSSAQSALGSSNPMTISSGLGSDSNNKVLVLAIATQTTTPRTGAAPYCGNGTFTQLGTTQAGSAECTAELWYLVLSGAYLSPITVPNTNNVTMRLMAVLFNGSAASLFSTPQQTGVSSANPSLTINSVPAGGVCVSVLGHGYKDAPTGRSHTIIYSNDEGNYSTNSQYMEQGSLGNVTMSWTFAGSDDVAMVMAAFQPTATITYTVTGNIALSLIPGSAINKSKTIVGSISVSLVPSAAVNKTKVYAGSLTLFLTLNSTSNHGMVHAGNVTLAFTPNSSSHSVRICSGNILFTLTQSHAVVRSYARTGSVLLTLMPNSNYQLSSGYSAIGNISLTITPASPINKIKAALGSISLSLTPDTLSSLVKVVLGTIPFSLIPQSQVSRAYAVKGDIDILLTPEGLYSLNASGYRHEGDIPLVLTPESGVVRVWSREGEIIFTLTLSSEDSCPLPELVRLNSAISRQSSIASLIAQEASVESGIGKIVSLSSPIRKST